MKKLLLVPFFVMLMIACGPGKNDIVKANNQLVAVVTKASQAEKTFFESCASYNPATIVKALNQFTTTCSSVKAELEAIEVHEDLAKLKASAIHLVDTYLGLEKEYAEYARLYSIPTENYSEEDEKQTSATAGKITDTINAEYDAYETAQNELSEKYHFEFSKKGAS